MKGKFFCFGTQISSKFAGGSGAETCLPAGRLNRILEKSSSLVVNPHKNQTFRNCCGFFFGDLQKSPLFLRYCARFARGQNEVRLPYDFKRNFVFFLLCPKKNFCF